jgi:hypothetical protein
LAISQHETQKAPAFIKEEFEEFEQKRPILALEKLQTMNKFPHFPNNSRCMPFFNLHTSMRLSDIRHIEVMQILSVLSKQIEKKTKKQN